jgi:glutathione S-transferase
MEGVRQCVAAVRLWQIPYSTNVERVALALAHKGLDAEPVVLSPDDRSAVVELTGQDLVPVLEHDGDLIWDSPRILAHLESAFPEAPLLPDSPSRRQEILVFCDWFNRVWKQAPNRIAEAGPGGFEPGDAAELRGSLDRFEDLLDGRDHLFGSEMTLADVTAFPFLKYGWVHDPDDDEPFHNVLAEHLALDPRHSRLRIWVERMDERPRAGIPETVSNTARSGS